MSVLSYETDAAWNEHSPIIFYTGSCRIIQLFSPGGANSTRTDDFASERMLPSLCEIYKCFHFITIWHSMPCAYATNMTVCPSVVRTLSVRNVGGL